MFLSHDDLALPEVGAYVYIMGNGLPQMLPHVPSVCGTGTNRPAADTCESKNALETSEQQMDDK